jgi:hypothetical protein
VRSTARFLGTDFRSISLSMSVNRTGSGGHRFGRHSLDDTYGSPARSQGEAQRNPVCHSHRRQLCAKNSRFPHRQPRRPHPSRRMFALCSRHRRPRRGSGRSDFAVGTTRARGPRATSNAAARSGAAMVGVAMSAPQSTGWGLHSQMVTVGRLETPAQYRRKS